MSRLTTKETPQHEQGDLVVTPGLYPILLVYLVSQKAAFRLCSDDGKLPPLSHHYPKHYEVEFDPHLQPRHGCLTGRWQEPQTAR